MMTNATHGASPGKEILISLRHVVKSYQMGEVQARALGGVSIEISRGGIVALMGPSGSGKSTLLNLIGAIDSPTSGEVLVLGQHTNGFSNDEKAEFRNRKIGFIFQTFNLVPVFTALENVMLPAELSQHAPHQGAHERAVKLLEMVGLGKQLHQGVNKLSGGQMQRVSIARALMNRPPIILADEPTANLDHDTADTVLSILRDTCATEGATVLVATHDFHVLSYCQRIVKLRDGLLVGDETKT